MDLMDVILLLLAVSAIVGLVFGLYFSWIAIAASGLVLAIVSATVLEKEGFGFFRESRPSSPASRSISSLTWSG
jgi:hypothetical protein